MQSTEGVPLPGISDHTRSVVSSLADTSRAWGDAEAEEEEEDAAVCVGSAATARTKVV